MRFAELEMKICPKKNLETVLARPIPVNIFTVLMKR